MPRIAPTLYDFVGLDDGEYLEVAEAVLRIFDRQDFLRVNRARARLKVFVDKFGIDELRTPGRRGAQGRLGRRARLRRRRRACSTSTRRPARPPRPGDVRLAQRRPLGVRALPRVQRQRPAPGGLRRRRGQGHPRRPDARAVPRPRPDHARLTPAATRARPCTRTCVLRWVRDETRLRACGSALRRARASATPAPTRSPTSSLPRHRLAASSASPRSMGLNEAVQERVESMDITDPLTTPHPHQDERLPQRLQPAPHRQHRLLRRVDQGRRAHDPGLRRPHRRQLRGRRDRLRHAPEGPPARQARARGRRALDPLVRGRARRRARSSTPSPSASGPTAFEDQVRDLAMPIEFGLETMDHFIDWNRNVPFEVIRGEGECAV